MPKPPNTPSVATYSFNGMDLRVVEIDGEPWFVAVDILRALGLDAKKSSNHLDKLEDDQKMLVRRNYTNPLSVALLGKFASRISLVSESGLYKLTMRSDKKEAKQFQEWVTREVLPSIRKTGTYTMPGAKKTIEVPKAAEAKKRPPTTIRETITAMRASMRG